MTIAALQYDVLRRAWPEARATHDFSEADEAEWAGNMDFLWQQMTAEEQEAVEAAVASSQPGE